MAWITGKVILYKDRPEIEMTNPDQIEEVIEAPAQKQYPSKFLVTVLVLPFTIDYLNHILMDYDLEIPVTYKNQELVFPAKFIQFGYSYKFEIDLNGITVFFERDEERNFRAIIDPHIEHRDDRINKELAQLIAESLTAMLK